MCLYRELFPNNLPVLWMRGKRLHLPKTGDPLSAFNKKNIVVVICISSDLTGTLLVYFPSCPFILVAWTLSICCPLISGTVDLEGLHVWAFLG